MFRIVHLSDLHLRENWHEEQSPILAALFSDLSERGINKETDILVFSGDLIAEGTSVGQITEFEKRFGPELNKYFSTNNLFFCPGNHEVDRDHVTKSLALLRPYALANDDETKFNTDLRTNSIKELIANKFRNAFTLSRNLFGASLTEDTFFGAGFEPNPESSVYVLNTALLSFGGVKDAAGNAIVDKELLRVETRHLRKWIEENRSPFRVLVTHHPSDWLAPWAKKALETIAKKHFDLHLQGHEHSPSIVQNSYTAGRVVVVSAPALHTRKENPELGYSITTVEPRKQLTVKFRQWSPQAEAFVRGTTIAGNDSGEVRYQISAGGEKNEILPLTEDGATRVRASLAASFDVSLNAYRILFGN